MTLSGNLEPWYNMEESIGERLCSFGPWYNCWEAVGRASDISKGVVFTEIKKLLESRHEDLHERESVHHAITTGVYMIGRTQKRAKPHIMFSCERKSPRTRAVKMVRDSEILKDHPGVLLGEFQRPPSLSRSPVQLVNQGSNQKAQLPSMPTMVYCTPRRLTLGSPGIQISIMREEVGMKTIFRDATLGGFVRVGEETLGLTIAHAFRNPAEVIESNNFEDMEFSFKYDGSSEEEDEDTSLVSITSRGSNSPKQSDSDNSGTSTSITVTRESSTQPSFEACHIERDIDISAPKFHPPRQKDIENEEKELIGQLLVLSNDDSIANLDWALIRLSNPILSTKIIEMEFPSNWVEEKSIGTLVTEPVGSKVAVLTGSNGILQGSISGNVTLMQFPPSRVFQEVWTVHIEGLLKPGDCGAWVVDATTGALYGHIVAGDPAVSIAYITPACQILSNIERCLGDKVVLPSSRRPLPERLLNSSQQSNLSKNTLSTLESRLEALEVGGILSFRPPILPTSKSDGLDTRDTSTLES